MNNQKTIALDELNADLKVFGPYSDGTFDIEVWVMDVHMGTKTIANDNDIVGDTAEFVTKCVALYETYDENDEDFQTLTEG